MKTSCFVEDIKINTILFSASRQNYFLINSDFITAYFLFQAPKQIGRLLYLHRRIGIILNKQKKRTSTANQRLFLCQSFFNVNLQQQVL